MTADPNTICYYTVTSTTGLNVRSGPGTNYPIQYVLNYNETVAAYEYHEASGSGYTWRQLDDNNWAVTRLGEEKTQRYSRS